MEETIKLNKALAKIKENARNERLEFVKANAPKKKKKKAKSVNDLEDVSVKALIEALLPGIYSVSFISATDHFE